MLLQILSDLHTEFAPFQPPDTEADVVVLAGDIHIGLQGLEWAKRTFPHKPVLYVLGNHEYYGQALPGYIDKVRNAARDTNIHVLENESIEIEGITFLGCTLWTDFELFYDPISAMLQTGHYMSDFRKIRVEPEYRKLRPQDTLRFHKASLGWLKQRLADKNSGRVVVVTHHAPSALSLSREYGYDSLHPGYASNLDEIVERSKALAWIHGHIHAQSDYTIGRTRIVCNPRGYPDTPNEAFVPDFLLEVGG